MEIRAFIDDLEKWIDNSSPLERLENIEIRTVILRAIDNLLEDEKTVLYMHYNDGLTFEQIGIALGLTRNESYYIKLRAMKKLRFGVKLLYS